MTNKEAKGNLMYALKWNDMPEKEALKIAIKALDNEDVFDKIKGYIDHIRNTGMGKKKSLEFIEKFIEGLKAERSVKE